MESYDVCVVGGGIAGVSAAHFIAQRRTVIVLEREQQLAHHTTGRSAALYFENYGHRSIRSLSKASRRFFEAPPKGLTDAPLLSERGAMTIARVDQMEHLRDVTAAGLELGTQVRELTPDEACGIVPAIRGELLAGALWEPEAADMDVAGLHQAFVRGIRRAGGEIRTAAPVVALDRRSNRWVVTTDRDQLVCDVVVDAA
jgi:D-arginine dehydrogenase